MPLTGEPLSLDLLNTRSVQDGEPRDLLADTGGLGVWLAANGLDSRFTADEPTLDRLRRTREALLAVVERPDDAAAARRLDAVLDQGRIRATLGPRGAGEETEFADPARGPAWTAAYDYLRLLRTASDRIRACAHTACVLHFFDTSRNGTRRWCSMAACGNRAKASRHYARSREA